MKKRLSDTIEINGADSYYEAAPHDYLEGVNSRR